MTENNKRNHGTTAAVVRETYEAKVGMEAVARAGKNPNLKGIVHEVMVKDVHNMNPANIVSGKTAVMTQSTTAVRDDLLVKQGGEIVKRMQLKDTPASISKTIKQVTEGHYAGTNLMGTKETVEAYNAAVDALAKKGVSVSQKMTSTGISSSDTARIATKTLGQQAAGKLTAQAVKKAAGSSGVAGGAISGGIEVLSSGKKLVDGEIDGYEFVGNVVRESAGGGISAATGTAAATVVTTGAATLLAGTTAPLWVPAAAGVATAVAVGSAVKTLWDSFW